MTPSSAQIGIDAIVRAMGKAGRRLRQLEACEGGAGNISLAVRGPVDVAADFPVSEVIEIPAPVPALPGATVIATGSGSRLRDLLDEPEANLGCVVGSDRKSGTLWAAPEHAYECMRLASGATLRGPSDDGIRAICKFHNFNQAII